MKVNRNSTHVQTCRTEMHAVLSENIIESKLVIKFHQDEPNEWTCVLGAVIHGWAVLITDEETRLSTPCDIVELDIAV